MKAMINTTRTSKMLTIALTMMLSAGNGYSQGMIAEGARKAFQNLMNKKAEQQLFIPANYRVEDVHSYTGRNYSGTIIKSFEVNNVELSLESDLKTEAWMTTPLYNEVETRITVADWMTTPVYNELESEVAVEKWMTTPVYNELEPEVAVEEWMTTPVYNELEPTVKVESWMTTPII